MVASIYVFLNPKIKLPHCRHSFAAKQTYTLNNTQGYNITEVGMYWKFTLEHTSHFVVPKFFLV